MHNSNSIQTLSTLKYEEWMNAEELGEAEGDRRGEGRGGVVDNNLIK